MMMAAFGWLSSCSLILTYSGHQALVDDETVELNFYLPSFSALPAECIISDMICIQIGRQIRHDFLSYDSESERAGERLRNTSQDHLPEIIVV